MANKNVKSHVQYHRENTIIIIGNIQVKTLKYHFNAYRLGKKSCMIISRVNKMMSNGNSHAHRQGCKLVQLLGEAEYKNV